MTLKITRSLFVAAALAISFSPPAAADFGVVGAGATSCSTWIGWLKADNMPMYHATGEWVVGFISGFNAAIDILRNDPSDHETNIAKPVGGLELLAWARDWCVANPAENVSGAAQGLVKYLIKGIR